MLTNVTRDPTATLTSNGVNPVAVIEMVAGCAGFGGGGSVGGGVGVGGVLEVMEFVPPHAAKRTVVHSSATVVTLTRGSHLGALVPYHGQRNL